VKFVKKNMTRMTDADAPLFIPSFVSYISENELLVAKE